MIFLHYIQHGEASAKLLNCSTQHPLGHSGLYGAPLKSPGQCHHFFSSHHSDILDALEFSQREEVLSPQHTQAEQSSPPGALF